MRISFILTNILSQVFFLICFIFTYFGCLFKKKNSVCLIDSNVFLVSIPCSYDATSTYILTNFFLLNFVYFFLSDFLLFLINLFLIFRNFPLVFLLLDISRFFLIFYFSIFQHFLLEDFSTFLLFFF